MPTSPSDADPTTGSDPEQLRRLLGRRQIVLLGLGSALGTGLFLGSGQSVAGAGPAVVLSFVAGTLIAGVVAFALGELSSVHPVPLVRHDRRALPRSLGGVHRALAVLARAGRGDRR